MSHRYSPYSNGVSSRLKSFATPQYADSTAYNGLSAAANFDAYSTSASACSWARPNYSPHYGLSYSDEPASHYSTQPPPPSYMLPNTDPMNNLNSCYLNGSLGRAQQAGLWSDQLSSGVVASSMASSHGTHSTAAYGSHGSENTASFHAINTSSTDRILPTPSASRTLAAAPQSSLDTQNLSALSHSHRNSLGWNTDTPSSTSATSSRTSNSTDSDCRIVSAGTSQEMGFGYIGISHSTQDLTSMTEAAEISRSPHANRQSTDSGRRVRTISRDSSNLAPSPSDAVTNYGYSTGTWDRNHNHTLGHLMNGQLYHRVPSISTARASVQQDCAQDAEWDPPRLPRAPLSNSSSFSNSH